MSEITIKIELSSESENIPADGKTPFRLMARVTDLVSGSPVSDANLIFTLDSKNAFFDGNVNTIIEATNQEGEIHFNVYDTEVESVSVTAALSGGDTATPIVININFTEVEPLKFSRIFNENKSFPNGTPTIAWTGAILHITTTGGSGDISWYVEGISGIEIINIEKDRADFYFTEYTDKNTDGFLVAKDNSTGTEARHRINISHFFKSYGVFAVRNPDEIYPELETLQLLYSEWGSFKAYPNWGLSNGVVTYWGYWFNDPNNRGLVDLYNGQILYAVRGENGIAKE